MEHKVSYVNYYQDAKAKGKKEYNRLKAKGLSGHLSSLDGILRDSDIVGNVTLVTFEIPLSKVVGTYYNARRILFSKSFFPMGPDQSEFSSKWTEVCRAQLTEGLRDPIKVYEYLNYFYVMEGNKRVSVLKYLGATSFPAEVTRIIPRYDENDEDIVNYYAFMTFYDQTKLGTIWLSKHYRYERLFKYLEDYHPDGVPVEARFEHFNKYVFQPFRKLFKAAGGDTLSMTTGDAFLLYAKLYKITEPVDESQVQALMPNLLLELSNYGTNEELEILTDAEDMSRSNLLGSISALFAPKSIKVGFVYARDATSSGWTYSHTLGRKHVESMFDGQIETGSIDHVPEDDSAYEVIKNFAIEGSYDVIFTTSEVFRHATLKCAIELPKIKFFSCSGNRPYVHMANYFGRTYEPRFLTGVIAGAMTRSNLIGYTATDPNPEVVSSINAFALGAKLVNPHARVLVAYTGEWNNPQKSTNISECLIHRGADIISNKNIIVPRDVTWDYGVYAMLCDIDEVTKLPKHYLAAPIWNWGVFYEKIISSLLNGSYQRMLATSSQSQKVINFWWGLDLGVVDLYMANEWIPIDTVKLIKHLKQMIISDQFNPFVGPVLNQSGETMIADDQIPTPEEIMAMDWFVDNVEVIEQK
ncbi:MAG TPA: BMP family ABC transporter substrate-binding protein [Fusibacter sp.]|nr:BMP family ABC transporter substrate-binding protein [Fusibacter sp.]